MIKRTVRQARLDRTGLDWRNFKIAELAENGDMIGFCQVRRYASVRGGLGSLYVRKTFRGQAIGGALIRACLAEQSPPVHLECVEARQSDDEHFGFRRIPKRAGAAGVGSQVVHRRNAGLAGSTPNHYRYALGGLTSTRVTIHVCRSAARTPPATAFLGVITSPFLQTNTRSW